MSWFVVATEVGGTAAADVGVTALGSEFGTTALFSELGAGGMGELMGLGSLGVGSGAQTMSGIPSLMQQATAANLPAVQQITAAQQAAQTANLAQQIGQFGQTGIPQAVNPITQIPQVPVVDMAGTPVTQTVSKITPPAPIPTPIVSTSPAPTVAETMGPAEQSWLDKFGNMSTQNKLLTGSLGLQALPVVSQLAGRLFGGSGSGVPERKPYDGPLSKFKYNKDAYTPLTTPQPTAYQPKYTNYRGYADGGLTALDAAIKTVRENPPTDYQNYYTPNSSPSTAFESYYAPTEIPAQYDYLQNPNPPQYATPVLQDYSDYANQSARTTNPVQAPVTLSFPQPPAPVADTGGGAADSGGYSPGSPGDQGGFGAATGGLMAAGGMSHLGDYSDGGRMLKGPGDGMSDSIPATINNKQPARLANEEFVIPADVVSHLGNGSSDAGAKQLYKMMDKIRAARTGTKKQGKQINPSKYLPA